MIKKALISSNFQYSKTISNIFQKTKLSNNMSQVLNVSGYSVALNLHQQNNHEVKNCRKELCQLSLFLKKSI